MEIIVQSKKIQKNIKLTQEDMQFDNTNCTVGSTSTSTQAITFTIEVAASAKLISKYTPVRIAADLTIKSDKS